MNINKIIIILLSIILSACGSDDYDSYSIVKEWDQENQRGGTMLVGDSITQGWPEDISPENSFNRGISGDNSGKLVTRTWLIIKEQPEIIYLMIGTNDLQIKSSVEQTMLNIEWILGTVTDALPDTTIYLLGILPCINITNENVFDLNGRLESLSYFYENINYIDIFDIFWDGENIINTIDKIHPDRNGYILMAETISNNI